MSSLGKNICSDHLPIFLIGFFFPYWAVRVLYIVWLWFLIKYMICKYFLPFYGLSFTFLMISFAAQKFFYFDDVQFFYCFSLCCCAFDVIFRELLPNTRWWRFMAMFSSKSFTVLSFPFGSRFILSKFLCRVWGRRLPWWLSSKESAYQCKRHKRYRFNP